MDEPAETICAIETAIHRLEQQLTNPDLSNQPHLAIELQRLERRLQHIHAIAPVFVRPA